jgi:hypothetical protein
MKKRFILVLLFIFLLNSNMGVAMGEKLDYKSQVIEKYKNINLLDGVDQEEAVIIAQKYLIDEGLKNLLVISKPDVKNCDYEEGYWLVTFPTTSKVRWTQGLKWGSALVDKKSGKVIYRGEGPS